MLKLVRNVGEAIVVGGNLKVTVLRAHGRRVELGIEGPREIVVDRAEVDRSRQTGRRPSACARS